MSCISSNFSSFFLNSLNDPSEFAKYLSSNGGEQRSVSSSFEDFQVFGTQQQQQPQQQQQQQQQQYSSPHQLQQQQQQQQLNGAALNSNSNNNVSAAGGPQSELFNGVAHMATNANNNYAPHQQLQHHPAPPHHAHAQHPQHPHAHPHHPHYVHGGAATAASFHHNHLASAAAALNHNNLPACHANSGEQRLQAPGFASSHRWPTAVASTTAGGGGVQTPSQVAAGAQHFDGSFEFLKYLRHSNDFSESSSSDTTSNTPAANNTPQPALSSTAAPTSTTCSSSSSSLIDLDSSTTHKSRGASRKVAALLSSVSRASNSLASASTLDVFDHDAKHTIFDLHLHHMSGGGSAGHVISATTNSSNSTESSLELSNMAFPNSHLNASNSNTSSEGAAAGGSDFSMLNCSSTSSSMSSAPKPLVSFVIKDNFDVHPSHKVEEGIFQHMNKLPPKKKENLKQLGVRFTGQMTLADKSIVVENFIKFCQEYDIKDHRPYLSLNQSGLNKPEQIKFARFLGQGLPTFTLFCIYSNFKNLFCTKRTECYTKDGYNLPYILDKTKRFLSNTTADLKNMAHQQSNDGLDFSANSNAPTATSSTTTTAATSVSGGSELGGPMTTSKCTMPKALENLIICENFDVHETHRIEDGVCTHLTRLPPKKQETLKQFGIQSNQSVTYYEKYIVIDNYIKFCNEYKITDHRPFLDLHESGLPKTEQLKFVRYLGQGLPNLTLNKIYLAFKDVLGLNRIEKITIDGYNLDIILKKKKKNLYNRMHAAVHRESTEAARQAHGNSLRLHRVDGDSNNYNDITDDDSLPNFS